MAGRRLSVVTGRTLLVLLAIAALSWLVWLDETGPTSSSAEVDGEKAALAEPAPLAQRHSYQDAFEARNLSLPASKHQAKPPEERPSELEYSIATGAKVTATTRHALGNQPDAEVDGATDQKQEPVAIGEVLDADEPQGNPEALPVREVTRIGPLLDADNPRDDPGEQATGGPVQIGSIRDADAPEQIRESPRSRRSIGERLDADGWMEP